MSLFRLYLIVWFVAIAGYTSVTIANHGLDYVTPYFADLAGMAWPGQFNLDFLAFLCLGGIWLAWRHNFRLGGLILALAIFPGGMLLLGGYLLVQSYKTKGDIKALLLGEGRV